MVPLFMVMQQILMQGSPQRGLSNQDGSGEIDFSRARWNFGEAQGVKADHSVVIDGRSIVERLDTQEKECLVRLLSR